MSEMFNVRFFISKDIYTNGIKYYFRKKVILRDLIFSGIFLILSIDFLISYIKDSGNKTAFALLVVCISCIILRILVTQSRKKRVIQAALMIEGETELKVFENRITIKLGDNEEESEIFLDDKNVQVYEYKNMFIIDDDCCYFVPKDAFGEYYSDFVDKMKKTLKKRYIVCK